MAATPVALLHFDGTNGSTDFPDPIGNVWTASDFVVSTAQSKFGGASGVSSSGSVSTPDSPSLRLAGDITIDAQMRFNTLPLDDFSVAVASKNVFGLYILASPDGTTQYLEFDWTDDSEVPHAVQVEWTPTTDTWYHIEFDRSGDDGYFFVDGVQVGTTQDVSGAFFDGDNDLICEGLIDGFIDELRVCDGADHVADFTAPTAAYATGQLATADLTLPLKDVLGAGLVGGKGVGVIPLPLKQIVGSAVQAQTADSAFFLPMLRVSAAGVNGRAMAGRITLPMLQVLGYTGTAAKLTLPMLQVLARGAPGLTAAADLRLPMLQALAAGRADGVARGVVPLPVLQVLGIGVAGGAARAALTLPLKRLVATGVVGGVGTVAVTLPLLQVLARGIASQVARGVVTLPLLQVLGQLDTIVSDNFRTWVLNLRNKALTEYMGFEFNSFAEFEGKLLAASDAGLFILDASDADVAADIDAVARTGITDLGNSYNKRVPRIYYSGLLTDDMLYSVITRENGKHTYRLAQQGRAGLQQRPLKIGNAIKSRYWQFEFANEDGGDLSVHSLVVKEAGTGRRLQ